MSKKVYLILFIILCFGGWGLKIVPYLSEFTWLVMQMLFLLLGYIHWSRLEYNNWGKNYLGVFICIVIGIVLSMIPAWLYFGQGFFTSIIAYRRQILWLAVPVLLRIAPTEDDIVGATKVIVLLMWGVYLLRMFAPGYLYVDAETLEKYQETGNYGYVVGMSLIVIPLYYSIEHIISEGLNNKRCIFWVIICYAFLFILQNRSLLFASSIVILIFILKMPTQRKPIIILLSVLFIGLFLSATSDAWLAVLNRTQRDLSDEEYNRNVAYTYFLTGANTHFLQHILGRGFISTHTSSLVENMHVRGIYNSDVGFIGFWNEFGILPIIAFIYMSLRSLFDKAVPSYVGMMGLTILLCAPTISYFGYIAHSLNFILMYYLVCYFREYAKSQVANLDVAKDNSV